jgi:cob(I)alamin adenosyltransferase
VSAATDIRLLAGSPGAALLDTGLDDLRARLGTTRLNADREELERGLAQLVLTLVELLRQLMERQALHRVEAGTLTAEEIERLGATFMALAERMEELKDAFGLTDEDLKLNLGPLGDLM